MSLMDPQLILQPAIQALIEGLQSSPPLGRDIYLDPGSGSYLLQLLIAGLVGSAFMVRTFWSRIKAFFTGDQEEPTDTSSPDDEE